METWQAIVALVATAILAIVGWAKAITSGKRAKTERRTRVQAELRRQSAESQLRTREARDDAIGRQAEYIARLNERIRNATNPADLGDLIDALNAILDAGADAGDAGDD